MWKKVGLVLVLVGLVLVQIFGAVIPVSEAGPAEKERVVRIGVRAAFLGLLATMAVGLSTGMLDYGKYVTDQGGH